MKQQPPILEKSNCGVGFLASLKKEISHNNLNMALTSLKNLEHRGSGIGGYDAADGAGILTDIPFDLFGLEKNTFAVATLFTPRSKSKKKLSLQVFENTFKQFGLEIIKYRDVSINQDVLSENALQNQPGIKQAIIKRPKHCRTLTSFDSILNQAKQMTRTTQKLKGIRKEFFFASLSCRTIVYKALVNSKNLPEFYPDLKNPQYKVSFALFHRRFSTNTKTSWDKIQPFRLIAHNGEINTIEGNRSWAITREKAIGLRKDELITHHGNSDSGNLNGMVEALKYRSSIPHMNEILAIMMPPADRNNSFYKFWSRAMEPWDGPALIAYSDGRTIGARLDRNGFRPCRWALTENHFFLSSEAGSFEIDSDLILKNGSLRAGEQVTYDLQSGRLDLDDPSISVDNADVFFDSRLKRLDYSEPKNDIPKNLNIKNLFPITFEDEQLFLKPMISNQKEPIGSMGNTASLALFASEPSSLFDYFYQDFAQVTNPPLDYIREESVTDLNVYLGRKPNI